MRKPLWAYCFIERQKLESKLIIVPDEASERNAATHGILTAVGDQCENFIQELVGKPVIFKQHAGNWMTDKTGDEENRFFVCHEEDIIGVVED